MCSKAPRVWGVCKEKQPKEEVMRQVFGCLVAGAIVLAGSGSAKAQFALSVGSPYGGTQVTVGAPYAYAPYAPSVYVPTVGTTAVYPTGYAVPGTVTYSAGYSGYVPATTTVYPAPVYGYPVVGGYYYPRRVFRPFRPYRAYGWW
jgi:hypothetical protein